MQELALVDDHVSVDDSPGAMACGDAASDTVGPSVVTVTRTLVDAIPPMPMQVRI